MPCKDANPNFETIASAFETVSTYGEAGETPGAFTISVKESRFETDAGADKVCDPNIVSCVILKMTILPVCQRRIDVN